MGRICRQRLSCSSGLFCGYFCCCLWEGLAVAPAVAVMKAGQRCAPCSWGLAPGCVHTRQDLAAQRLALAEPEGGEAAISCVPNRVGFKPGNASGETRSSI